MEGTRKRKRQFCGHCDDFVSHTLFYSHKKTYFLNGVWIKDATDRPTLRVSESLFITQPEDNEHEQQPENDVDNTLQGMNRLFSVIIIMPSSFLFEFWKLYYSAVVSVIILTLLGTKPCRLKMHGNQATLAELART